MKKIRVAIAGVGNCALSLLQGVEFYSGNSEKNAGVMAPNIGPYTVDDIEFVCAFDIDKRKVNKLLYQAALAKPNCSMIFNTVSSMAPVYMAPILDGVAPHMLDEEEDYSFRPSTEPPVNIAEKLKEHHVDVLINYLPVGSEIAVKMYATACLEAGVAMINCMPVFIASDPVWAEKFKEKKIPIIGDDIKSQVGATIVHRMLAHLFSMRGYKLTKTYQLNTGGNTDFLNMKAYDRLKSKKISKTQSVKSQLQHDIEPRNIHIGPSDYVPFQGDNKVAFIRCEGIGFGGAPIECEMRLSVQDSPNSAGVVIDAIRYAKLGLDRGMGGPLIAPSAFLMKSPPEQIEDTLAHSMCEDFSGASQKG